MTDDPRGSAPWVCRCVARNVLAPECHDGHCRAISSTEPTPDTAALDEDVFGVLCHEPGCSWAEDWTTESAAQAAAVWHIHDSHPLTFLRVVGERPPADVKPEALGEQVFDAV